MEEHSMLVYKWWLLPDFRSTMSFIPKRHQLLPCAGFYPVSGPICSQSYYLQGSLPSVCTAMSVHLPSYMLCLFSLSSFVIYNSYSHTNYIHTFVTTIHSYINTFTYSYTSYTQHHSYMIALVTQKTTVHMKTINLLLYNLYDLIHLPNLSSYFEKLYKCKNITICVDPLISLQPPFVYENIFKKLGIS